MRDEMPVVTWEGRKDDTMRSILRLARDARNSVKSKKRQRETTFRTINFKLILKMSERRDVRIGINKIIRICNSLFAGSRFGENLDRPPKDEMFSGGWWRRGRISGLAWFIITQMLNLAPSAQYHKWLSLSGEDRNKWPRQRTQAEKQKSKDTFPYDVLGFKRSFEGVKCVLGSRISVGATFPLPRRIFNVFCFDWWL